MNVVISFLITFTLIMVTIHSSKTLVLKKDTRRHNPEDTILHSHRRENLKSGILHSRRCENLKPYILTLSKLSIYSYGSSMIQHNYASLGTFRRI
jgi:hypothetical protein